MFLFAETNRSLEVNPAWRPFMNSDGPGYLFLLISAAILVGLTLWTYLGAAQTTPRRLMLLVALRLLALLLAILTTLRPTISETETPPAQPYSLILVIDASESMTTTDEYDNLRRWEVCRRAMEKAKPILEQLEKEHEATIYPYIFAANFTPATDKYDPNRRPDGKRTDFGTMLHRLYLQHSADPKLRGLIILSDGADNGVDYPALAKANEWRSINCPIYTFAVGKTDTRTNQKDIAFTSISPDPSPVAVKSDLTIKAILNAQGLEGSVVRVMLKINDEPVKSEEFRLFKPTGNEIVISTKAPDKPGEIKVSLELEPPPREDVNADNNRIESYVTVLKEGTRILVIDRQRLELKYLRYALGSDKRFDLVQLIRQTDDAPDQQDGKQFNLLDGAYDVIILGDVSPARLKSIHPDLMNQIKELVLKRGVGLLMTGGVDSFGGTQGVAGSTGWSGTPIAELLPVELKLQAQITEARPLEMRPTAKGDSHFILRLDPNPEKNKKIWDDLNREATTKLGGSSPFLPKQGAEILAMGTDTITNVKTPLLVSQELGAARVLAFGGDQTWKWVNLGATEMAGDEGLKIHSRFWKQMVLWLAHQEQTTGSVYVLPELRRLAVNGKNTIRLGIKDKHGDEITEPEYLQYQVLLPGQKPDRTKARGPARDSKGAYAQYEVKQSGEHQVVVWGRGKDPDGSVIEGEKTAPFIVYPDISDELLRPAANHDFLLALESAANSVAPEVVRRVDKLPSFLQEEYVNKPLKKETPAPTYRPDWTRDGSSWFLPLLLVIFVTLLGLEWGLRRYWGMV